MVAAKPSFLLSVVSAVALLSSALLLPACADKGDLYATAYPACHDIKVPRLGNFLFDLTEDQRKATYLTPECKAALEAEGMIPYDRESFKDQPWIIDRINEAMQTLLADEYPLQMPSTPQIFGTHPSVGGAMPTDIARAIGSLSAYPQDLRRAIFNYILNQTDVVRLQFVIPQSGQIAQMVPEMGGRVMTIFKSFWDLDDPMTYLRNPFGLTGTLLHEARHADGITHSLCLDSGFSEGFNCDATLAGPYGTELFYYQALIHGSGVCQDKNGHACIPHASRYVISRAGYQMCISAKKRARTVYPELAQFLSDHEEEMGASCGHVAYTKTMELEGLPQGRYADDEPTTPKTLFIPGKLSFVSDPKTYDGSYLDASGKILHLGAPFHLEIQVRTE